MKKYLIILIIIAVGSAFWLFDLDRYLTLEGIKTVQAQLATWRDGAPLAVGLGFFVIYVAATALSLPGAAGRESQWTEKDVTPIPV